MHLNFKILIIFLHYFNLILCWPTFQFYSKNNPSNHVVVTSQNLTNSGFSHLKETKFVIHGFGDNGKITRMIKVKDQYLISHDINIIVVDWEKGAAAPDYFKAAANAKITGQKVGEFIVNNNIDPKKVHCVGHSLGAHICGFAGKIKKYRRISGLDPAGPLFKGKPKEERLDKTDAEFVDNIHTDWLYGIQDPIGHKDFYPNGGESQYGCSLFDGKRDLETISTRFDPRFDPIDLVACNHMRVPLYFAESINSNCRFKSVPCDTYKNFKGGKCNCSPIYGCSSMGHWADSTPQDEGSFYLDSNKSDPYCKE